MIRRLKKALKKLFQKELITKEQYEYNDYDLLTKIIKKRDASKKRLNNLKKTNLAMDVFYEVLEDNSLTETYTEKEISKIYENIIDED